MVRMRRMIGKLRNQLLVGTGLLILALVLPLTATVPGKDLAVALTFAGTCIGTALVSLFLPKILLATAEENAQRDFTRSESKQRVAQAEREAALAGQKVLDANREINRLSSMRIDVAAVQPMLKLGLLEVETTVTDFQQRPVGEAREEVWWRNGYRNTYVGVVRIPVKAHLGIDLQKVRLREVEPGRLVIGGITMVTVTDTAEGATWLLDEVRTEYLKDRQVVKFKGDCDDALAKTYSRAQELEVRARLNHGQDFRVFESGLIRTAEQLLRVLLAPLHKELIFGKDPGPESQDLISYLATHNRRIEAAIADLARKSEPPVPLS